MGAQAMSRGRGTSLVLSKHRVRTQPNHTTTNKAAAVTTTTTTTTTSIEPVTSRIQHAIPTTTTIMPSQPHRKEPPVRASSFSSRGSSFWSVEVLLAVAVVVVALFLPNTMNITPIEAFLLRPTSTKVSSTFQLSGRTGDMFSSSVSTAAAALSSFKEDRNLEEDDDDASFSSTTNSRRSFFASATTTTAAALLLGTPAPVHAYTSYAQYADSKQTKKKKTKRYVLNEETGEYDAVEDDEVDWQTEWKSRYAEIQTMSKEEVFQAARGAGNLEKKDLASESEASKKRRAFSACRDKTFRQSKLDNLEEKACTQRLLQGDLDFVLKVL